MPGPPPSQDPVRRNARSGPLKLPAEGRKGRTPAWPLPDDASTQERHAWKQLWSTPQAVAWDRLGWTRTVARYCRMLVLAEATMNPQLLGQVSNMEDRLGLTPKAMRMLLWEIAVDEVAEKREQSPGARGRIKAVS